MRKKNPNQSDKPARPFANETFITFKVSIKITKTCLKKNNDKILSMMYYKNQVNFNKSPIKYFIFSNSDNTACTELSYIIFDINRLHPKHVQTC